MIAISKNKKTLSNITQDKALYFCIENQFFRDYLAENFDEKNITYTNLDLIDLPGTISSNPNAIILHPGPVNRGIEIESALISCPQSIIHQQVSNGIPIRMALINHCLSIN